MTQAVDNLTTRLKRIVEGLCSDVCAGREAGTAGGMAARAVVREALAEAGCPPREQPVPGCGGVNLLSEVKGTGARWVLVGAHYDHLGRHGRDTFYGADDNAAAVAILVELGRTLATGPPGGRSVLLAAFDGEEPPHFYSEAMGSAHFVAHPTIPLNEIDLMICMDLVGHALGPEGVPAEVRQTLFALGAERSEGTSQLVDSLARAESGVIVRRVDADIIPPLSDHWAFWRAEVPFLFLTCGRSQHYHQPTDTPDKLDWPKMAATARWLERLVRAACARPSGSVRFQQVHDDASTLSTLRAILDALVGMHPMVSTALAAIAELDRKLDGSGRLPAAEQQQAQSLVMMIESILA
jgi:hypothetical protein